jgi:biotin carboxyl carrier protein
MSREIFKVSGKKAEWPDLRLDAQEFEAAAWTLTLRPGGWVLAERRLSNGEVERRRLLVHEARGKFAASLSGFHWHGELSKPARAGSGSAAGSDADLTAQFPGKVRKRVVIEGQTVTEGEPLILVEAMKMEFAIKAPFAGVVRKILVQEGQQLSPGDRFLELEPVVQAAKAPGAGR